LRELVKLLCISSLALASITMLSYYCYTVSQQTALHYLCSNSVKPAYIEVSCCTDRLELSSGTSALDTDWLQIV